MLHATERTAHSALCQLNKAYERIIGAFCVLEIYRRRFLLESERIYITLKSGDNKFSIT